jgi:hypothetical protein
VEISLICARCSADIVNRGSFGGAGMAMTTGSGEFAVLGVASKLSLSSATSASSACGGGVGGGGCWTPGGAFGFARGARAS